MANVLSVPSGSASGGISGPSATPVAGDNPIPYAAATLATGDSLTTGDLSVGEAGEFGLGQEMAVEFWFQMTALPGVDGTFVYGPLSSSGSDRQFTITLLAAGNLSFGLEDDTGLARTAAGAAVLRTGTWYHIVCTAQGGNIIIYLNGTSDGSSATWGSHSVRALGSTAGALGLNVFGPVGGGGQFYFTKLAVYRTGLTAARVLEHYTAGTARGFPFQAPGERIGAILDTASSYAPRSIQAGTRSVIPRYMSGQAPIEEIRRAVEAEDVDAAFFVTASGGLTFLADGHRSSSPYNTIQATFGDGDGEIPYLDLETDYSEAELINEWNVTRSPYGFSSPVTQTVSDATSISRYFKRSQSLSDVPTWSDANAANIATALLTKYKDPLYRITSISFDTTDPSVSDAVLQRELMDKVRIYRTPPGGGARIQQDVYIQKIDISGGNDGKPWSIRWAVSPL